MNKETSFLEAILPILVLIVLLTLNVFVFEDTLAGSKSNSIAACRNGGRFDCLEKGTEMGNHQ